MKAAMKDNVRFSSYRGKLAVLGCVTTDSFQDSSVRGNANSVASYASRIF